MSERELSRPVESKAADVVIIQEREAILTAMKSIGRYLAMLAFLTMIGVFLFIWHLHGWRIE